MNWALWTIQILQEQRFLSRFLQIAFLLSASEADSEGVKVEVVMHLFFFYSNKDLFLTLKEQLIHKM